MAATAAIRPSTPSSSSSSSTASSKSASTAAAARGVWSEAEHNRFLEALQRYPSGPWKLVAEHVGSRSVRQVQTHAQKYHEKVARRLRGLRKERKLVQRCEHRIDAEMMDICHELSRDSVPLPPRIARPSRLLYDLTGGQHVVFQAPDEAAYIPWGEDSSLLAPKCTVNVKRKAPPLSDCLDYLIDALSPSEYDSDESGSRRSNEEEEGVELIVL